VLAVNTIHQTSSVLAFTSLPGFGSGESSLPVLLGISHAGYIANKVPDKTAG